MMRLALLSLLALGLSAPQVAGESLFDDDEVAAYKEKQASQDGEEPAGESLFDDDEIAAYNQAQQSDDYVMQGNEVTFDSKEKALTADIVFDERGNVQQGGSSDPDIAFFHVVMLNGESFDEPTQGSGMLMELIEKGEDYEVVFAPPSFNQFQCTEKVETMEVVLERYSHEFGQELLDRVAATLANEAITNTKQLGEVDEKDYDEIKGLPALMKSRLRKVWAEARKQAEVAGGKVELDSEEVEAHLREYMAARDQTKGADGQPAADGAAKVEETQAATTAPVTDEQMEEEDGTFKSLVWAVLNCPTCKGKETIACFKTCRYNNPDGRKRTWSECLNECIENRWLRATFSAMLPSE